MFVLDAEQIQVFFHHSAFFLTSQLGPFPWETPQLAIENSLGVDGRAEPGLILLDAQWLETADPIYCHLTIAHELAHQWWGLAVQGEPFLREPMAEFWALRSVGAHWGLSVERSLLVCARGRMIVGLLNPDKNRYSWEARWLGRDVLAIHACWWRYAGNAAVNAMRQVAQSTITDQSLLLKSLWSTFGEHGSLLSRWASPIAALPTPRLEGNYIVDANSTGLSTLISVVNSIGQTMELWLDNQVEVQRDTRLAERQLSPVLAGNLAADVEYYHQRTGGSRNS